jgi:hypothetical protein
MLGQLASLASLWAQSDDDPLRQLRGSHPRLILPDSELERVRGLVRDNPLARRIYGDLEKESERLLTQAPGEYKLTGPRLRLQTRRVLDRVSTLALMYRLTKKETYLRRAVAELRAVANFRDWNPQVFVDTAEMAHAFALGYDWLYPALTPEERIWIRDAIVMKALDPALAAYQQPQPNGWPRDRFNRNIICNSAMGLAALAVAGDATASANPAPSGGAETTVVRDPAVSELNDKCSAVLRYALESIPRGLTTYGIEGSWPEGMDYWQSVTIYACVFFHGLASALGNDYGLSAFHGFDRAGRFKMYLSGPGGKVFNFGDSADDIGTAPEMFWLARRFLLPAYAWSEQRALERSPRPDAYDLVWFEANARPPQQAGMPLDGVFRSFNVACFRSAWGEADALYLAVKGGDNKDPHAHLDLGSFVLHAGGVRWAADLGPDDYDLPGYLNGLKRWSYYRTRTEAHNTLVFDDENQDLRAEARITRQENAGDLNWVQIDLSRANLPKVKQWTRRIGMAQRQAVLVNDQVRADQPVDVIWNMMTDADIIVSGQTATLKKGGWNLAAEIRTPRHAVFDVAPVHAVPPNAPNPGYKKLIVRLGDKLTELDLHITLAPYKDGQPRPKVTAQFPA